MRWAEQSAAAGVGAGTFPAVASSEVEMQIFLNGDTDWPVSQSVWQVVPGHHYGPHYLTYHLSDTVSSEALSGAGTVQCYHALLVQI